ncbi:MAG: sigma-54 dependent transcriptional regulator, partial [Thermodesulfobacteriaceae bacterium]|nr:sigma-54 dependent transcriptional regulator [Thermodesulfobacteriaceae bacterium]
AEFLEIILKEENYRVYTFPNAEKALKAIPQYNPPIVITDLKLPGMDGITFIEKAKKISPETEFILITAFGSIPSAVSALKKGAFDYLTKPLSSPEELLEKIEKVLKGKSEKYNKEEVEGLPPYEILFAGMEDIYENILEIAPTPTTILLLGETGTGKSAIAKAIHLLSKRKGPFVEINCASLPENLVEAELFGYEKGAFTGAIKTKPGKIDLAKDGSLFLDEISEMSLATQAKFLRVLQERKYERLGGLETLITEARFITATNKNLEQLVREGKFREDLYYRINVFSIYLPPLRQRKKALPIIIDYVLHQKAKKLGREPKPLKDSSLNFLLNYPFPGNIRELENILERALLLSKGEFIEINFENLLRDNFSPQPIKTFNLREWEKDLILKALEESQGNKQETAKKLGISLRTLYNKLKEFNIKD